LKKIKFCSFFNIDAKNTQNWGGDALRVEKKEYEKKNQKSFFYGVSEFYKLFFTRHMSCKPDSL
jgi:hypothetical protein